MSRSSIIEGFEKAKQKYQYYKSPIPPDTTIDIIRDKWCTLNGMPASKFVQIDPTESKVDRS